ncbi:selenocysteine-specific translation elongation factor [candidate division KSB1 bacterium]|nr:selenocysteine-specific translation elongation factor [candidate division KSB1 bacterium]
MAIQKNQHIIIGTAGHIDHGKSTLVRVLTGTDPDRLAEEQERGMTIDLGFAFLSENIAFIDVPGHERFIKNMVAGVSTVDMALLVIAADDGVMPQTREHLDILSLLNLKYGLVAITKADLVEDDWLQLIVEEVKNLVRDTFLRDAPIVPVSSTSGYGLPELKKQMFSIIDRLEVRADRGLFWMPVDRSFSMKGFGTVVTGSVLSGSARTGDVLEILPSQTHIRIRGIQKHGKSVLETRQGDRAAINLAAVSKEKVGRGDVIATPDYFHPSTLFDARLSLLKSAPKPLGNRTRIRLHLGTREILSRIKLIGCEKLVPGENCYVQLQLESPAVAMRRDAFVIRQYSPSVTIGGGIILDTQPKRHRRFDDVVLQMIKKLEQQDPAEIVQTALLTRKQKALGIKELAKTTGLPEDQLLPLAEDLIQKQHILNIGSAKNPVFFHSKNFDALASRLLELLAHFHQKNPLKPEMKKAELQNELGIELLLFTPLISRLADEGKIFQSPQGIKLASFSIVLNEQDTRLAGNIKELLDKNGFSTPSPMDLAAQLRVDIVKINELLGVLRGQGEVVRMEGDIYFLTGQIEQAKTSLAGFATQKTEISVSEFREMLNTSRKYALALLSYFDQIGATTRVEDKREITREYFETERI